MLVILSLRNRNRLNIVNYAIKITPSHLATGTGRLKRSALELVLSWVLFSLSQSEMNNKTEKRKEDARKSTFSGLVFNSKKEFVDFIKLTNDISTVRYILSYG